MAMNEEHLKAVSSFKRPIPGSSLTNDPDIRQAHENPTEFTVQREAIEYLYSTLITEQIYIPLLQAVKSGIPVVDLSQSILFKGFVDGKWNPDLMLLLIEPLAYMIMALAERAGINYKVYTGEEEDDSDLNTGDIMKKKLESIRQNSKTPTVHLPKEIQENIENLDINTSLLAKPDEESLEVDDSLLGQGE